MSIPSKSPEVSGGTWCSSIFMFARSRSGQKMEELFERPKRMRYGLRFLTKTINKIQHLTSNHGMIMGYVWDII